MKAKFIVGSFAKHVNIRVYVCNIYAESFWHLNELGWISSWWIESEHNQTKAKQYRSFAFAIKCDNQRAWSHNNRIITYDLVFANVII